MDNYRILFRDGNLSDEILHHILSLIDTRQAVQTTILSKRWKDLCRSLPDLRLDFTSAAFYDLFFFHYLLHRDAEAPVDNLHLSFDDIIDLTPVEESVLHAINHGVQSLRLHAPNDLPLSLPAALFTSTTLRELELKLLNTVIHVPGRFLLPNLKTLDLETFLTFDDDNRMETFAGLPELEKLSLRGCPLTSLVLKAPKLRDLEIIDSCCLVEEISAPLLTSFRYEGYAPSECSKMNVPMLEEVYLDIHGITYNLEWLHLKCVRLFKQLGNATTVTLTLDTLKVLEKGGGPIEQSPPPFPNLKCLKVMKGSNKISTVLESVINYLTRGTLYFESLWMIKLPQDVVVVQQNSDDQAYDDLYYEDDSTQSSQISN